MTAVALVLYLVAFLLILAERGARARRARQRAETYAGLLVLVVAVTILGQAVTVVPW